MQDNKSKLFQAMMTQQAMQQNNPMGGGQATADALAKALGGYMMGKSMRKPATPAAPQHPSTYGMTV